MHTKYLIPVEELRNLLWLDPVTFDLYWRTRTPDMFPKTSRDSGWTCRLWNSRYAGTVAGGMQTNGYICVKIHKSLYKAHRIIWAMHYGEWPKKHLDHINQNRSDNRISNLRQVTKRENARNAKLSADNTSGVCGVSWATRDKVWVAFITTEDGFQRLGSFKVKQDAINVRKAAEKKHGFHKNHGNQHT